MFGTVIIDAYREKEKQQMADAIDDLCCPNDNYGWASAGIYCFWDYYTHEVLYIGLAGDLAERFMQHNGLLHVESGSKEKQINEYFKSHELLGYSIFVQSPLSQPLVHRNKNQYEKFAKQINAPVQDLLCEQGKNDIHRVEGILIEAYRGKHGDFPRWNRIGGDIEGQNRVLPNNYNIVNAFAHPEEYEANPIVSRCTIRELSENPSYEFCENYLHAVRMYMFMFGMDYTEAFEFTNKNDPFHSIDRIYEMKYFDKKLVV